MDNKLLTLELSKSIKRLNLSLGNINVLIGANGSGKSNLISFFKLLNYLCTESLQEFIALGGGANSHLYFGVRQTPAMEGTVVFSGNKGNNRYHIKLAHGAGDRLVFLEESIQFRRNDYYGDKVPLLHSLRTERGRYPFNSRNYSGYGCMPPHQSLPPGRGKVRMGAKGGNAERFRLFYHFTPIPALRSKTPLLLSSY